MISEEHISCAYLLSSLVVSMCFGFPPYMLNNWGFRDIFDQGEGGGFFMNFRDAENVFHVASGKMCHSCVGWYDRELSQLIKCRKRLALVFGDWCQEVAYPA